MTIKQMAIKKMNGMERRKKDKKKNEKLVHVNKQRC
tara:strand:+ start:3663 stop:3770 length:108 start_codon:yes stop_codon:yes gene_type:complete